MPVPPCGNYGDVNNDGNVTITDAMYVSQYLVNARTLTDDQLIRSNVKGYGDVSEEDVDLISKYVAGTIDTFPVCGVTPPIDTSHVISIIISTGASMKVDGVEVI